ncbi:hypothetical protein [Spirillospora sp. NPDC048823]|uniref:hypothetical protein n=1 Tax=unclassified Spirillospora TaxID=2642701 RepID=UPI0037103811
MRRLAIVLVSALLAAGCGGVPGAGTAEDRAADDARKAAVKISERLYSSRVRPAQDVAHRAADLRGVEVMRVAGATTGEGDGVRVVVRVSGTAAAQWPDAHGPVTVKRCFELRFAAGAEWHEDEPRGVRCPAGEPLTFEPWPRTPDIPAERLEKALPRVPAGGRADEGKVRAAVASLRLDPAVRREFTTDGDVVGVVLSVKPYLSDALDCVLARVAPGRTSVWSPPRIQRTPGEGGCSAGNAVHPMPPPH